MKVLIFYATYGGGHLSAANAMKEAIEINYPEYEVQVVDCMKYVNKVVNGITVKAYEDLAKKMPKTWGKIYKASRKGILAKISNSSNDIFASKLGKLINSINPDVIISVHPFSTQMCGILKKRGKLNLPVFNIMTDFKYHEQWLVKHEYIDKHFVSNEKMRQDLIKFGIDENKVFTTGIPISSRFLNEFDRKEILMEFGIKENLKTILFFAGGKMGLARKNIFEFMQVLANDIVDIQVIAISGKNPKVYERFKDIAKDKENVKVIEFSNRVPELMSVSDVVITKPGGITSSEALAMNIPIIAINPIPGQEEENAEFLEESGVAIWIKNNEDIHNSLKEAIIDERIVELKGNIKKYAKANAGTEICRIIFEK